MKPPLPQLGEYRLDAVIQDGPYAMAVKGFQPSLRRPVFIKLLKPHIRHQEQWLIRFRREAQICADLKSPYIVDVYTVGEQDGYFYLVLEFIDGKSLDKTLGQRQKLPVSLALDIARQVTLALQAAHEQGIIHRDLKPGNILVDRNGHAKLTDFGMAHLGEETTITQQADIIGTPAYMAPEQITGEALVPATDFFALGATVYEMLTGVKPFDGENYSICLQRIMNEMPPPPSRHNDRIPAAVDGFVLNLLEKEAHRRPQNADDVLKQLEKLITGPEVEEPAAEFFSGSPTLLSGETPAQENAVAAPGKQRRHVGLWSAALILVAVIISILFISRKRPLQNNSSRPEANIAVMDSIKTSPKDSTKVEASPTGKPQNRDNEAVAPTPPPKESAPAVETTPPVQSAVQNAAATLHIQVQPWANISIDGRVVDSLATSWDGRLSAGAYRVALMHSEFSPKIFTLSLKAGAADTIIYSFYERAAWLDINVRPWADVYIDGKYIDSTPLKRLVVVESGSHLVELRNPYFKTFRQLIQTTAGDTLLIQKVLQK